MKDDGTKFILVTGAAFVVLLVACGAIAYGVRGRLSQNVREDDEDRPTAARATDPLPGRQVVAAASIPVPNPSRADLADLVPLARKEALKLNPMAKFVGVNAFELRGGVVDIPARETGKHPVLFDFEYSGFDKTKPPGKDKVEGRISVRLAREGFAADDHSGFPAIHLREDAFFGGVLDTPTCKSAKAWAQAVKSGVPENAVARITLEDDRKWSPEHPQVWRIWVDGHDEYSRKLDAKTCEVVGPASPKAAEGDPQRGKHRKKR